jgi:hypothetical protein
VHTPLAYPAAQLQLNAFDGTVVSVVESLQVAPFMHGLLAHSLTSTSQVPPMPPAVKPATHVHANVGTELTLPITMPPPVPGPGLGDGLVPSATHTYSLTPCQHPCGQPAVRHSSTSCKQLEPYWPTGQHLPAASVKAHDAAPATLCAHTAFDSAKSLTGVPVPRAHGVPVQLSMDLPWNASRTNQG